MRDPKDLLAIAKDAEQYRADHPDEEVLDAVRPADSTPPKVVLSVRVDGILAEQLAVAARKAGTSVSDLVRFWLTDRAEAEHAHADRVRIADDLEQIARLVRAGV